MRNNEVVGSALIGQDFTSDRYFHGRPSATTAPDPQDSTKTVPKPYNAAGSGGLRSRAHQQGSDRPGQWGRGEIEKGKPFGSRSDRSRHHVGQRPRPGHLAGSGVLPGTAHRRREKAPGGSGETGELVHEHIERPLAGVLGESHVNVLSLNLALDQAAPK